MPCHLIPLLAMLPFLFGCITVPSTNPDYPASDAAIDAEWQRLAANPAPLPRTLILLNGYRGPVWQVWQLRARLLELTGAPDGRIIALSYFWQSDIDEIASFIVAEIDRLFPSADPAATIDVDVVGISMGGIVARAAALDAPGRKRLAIRRLYTLASPHRGALLAEIIAPDSAARDLRPGSTRLAALDAALPGAPYELVCYTRLRDGWVGATRAAPPGRQPIWTPGLLIGSHLAVGYDRRILVDLALRLRSEKPLAREGAPPPSD